jgi:hypothetical protein
MQLQNSNDGANGTTMHSIKREDKFPPHVYLHINQYKQDNLDVVSIGFGTYTIMDLEDTNFIVQCTQ